MSRKMKGAGWVNYKKHPRGPNGRGLCRMCGVEVPKGRRTFCGEDCVEEYRMRNDTRHQANVIAKRDRGTCQICGTDTNEIKKQYLTENRECKSLTSDVERRRCYQELDQRYKDAGWNVWARRWWDVDHVLPVVEGGGPDDWGEEPYIKNLRTLCHPCHKKETAKLRKRLSERKKEK